MHLLCSIGSKSKVPHVGAEQCCQLLVRNMVRSAMSDVCFGVRRQHSYGGDISTNIASVHLVMGCPNARTGVKIVRK